MNWSCTKSTFLTSLELKVKKAIRLITFKNKYEHTGPLFSANNILPLHELIKHKKSSFMWKVLNGYISPPVSCIFTKNRYNQTKFNRPNPDSDIDKTKLVYSCVSIWNSISSDLRSLTTLNSFNKNLKKHILNQLNWILYLYYTVFLSYIFL